MKAENVTCQRDPEFFALMSKSINAWDEYYRALHEYEAHPVRTNLRWHNRALKAAEAAQTAEDNMALARGYEPNGKFGKKENTHA